MELNEIIEKAKTRANITSDYALAKVLGIERQIVSDWKRGKKHPSTDEAVKLATLAGLEEMKVIAEIEMQTAKTEKKREFWKSYIDTKGLTATLGLIALGLSILLTPEPAEANVLQLANYDVFLRHNDERNIHYAYFRIRQGGIVRGMVSRLTYPRLAVVPSAISPI